MAHSDEEAAPQGGAVAPFIFGGIDSPNTTSFPDVLLDRVMAHVSGAEFKVLAYVVRRTFGFKKNSDTISLDQICHGITRRDGSTLDEGTGLTRKTAIAALKGLEEKGVITVQRRSSPTKGNLPSSYALRFRGGPPDHDPDPRARRDTWRSDDEQADDEGDVVVEAGGPTRTTSNPAYRGGNHTASGGVQKGNRGGVKTTPPPVQQVHQGGVRETQGVGEIRHPQHTDVQHTDKTTDGVVAGRSSEDITLATTPGQSFDEETARALALLLREGVAPVRALDLCARHTAHEIEQQVRWLDSRRYDDRAACLVAAIEAGYQAPVSSRNRPRVGAVTGRRDGSHYTKGAYGVCPACGCSPCDADCPGEGSV